MTLNEFINRLEVIVKDGGGLDEVVMADYIPITGPVHIDSRIFGGKVIITDQE